MAKKLADSQAKVELKFRYWTGRIKGDGACHFYRDCRSNLQRFGWKRKSDAPGRDVYEGG